MSTPYMNLDLPTPSTTLGPTWASMLNTALSAVDSHDHTNGKGLPVTPAGMLINAALDFAGNAATDVESVQFSTLASSLLTPSNIHSVNGDLVWTNSSGVAVPITSGNAVVGAPGNIQNLGPPASAVYSTLTSTFQWLSAPGTLAGLDAGFLLLRAAYNPLANAVQVQAPAAVPSTWTLTLPSSPSGSSVSTLVTVNPSGAMGYYYLDEYTVGQSGTLIGVLNGGIRGQLAPGAGTPTGQLALRTIGTANIGLGQVTGGYDPLTGPTGLLAYRTIATENIEERAITTAKVALDTITGGSAAGQGNLAPSTIRSWNIPFDEIEGDRLKSNSINGLKITNEPNGISNNKLNSGAVDARTLGLNAVQNSKILDGAVTLEKVSTQAGFAANAFNAPYALILGTPTVPWIIATTPNLNLVAGRNFRVTLQPKDNAGLSARFYCVNESGTEQFVYLRLKVRSSSGLVLRTFIWSFWMRPNILGNQIPYNITLPPVVDTATQTSSQNAMIEIYTASGSSNNIKLSMDDIVLTLTTL